MKKNRTNKKALSGLYTFEVFCVKICVTKLFHKYFHFISFKSVDF